MLFRTLMDQYLDEELKPAVEKLLDIKMNTPEIGEGKRIDCINDYLNRNIEDMEHIISELATEDVRD